MGLDGLQFEELTISSSSKRRRFLALQLEHEESRV
jgi:hypothetical protein